MSLTMMEVPIARSGVRAERLVFIDNLRWSAISMVVVIHAAVTYSAVGSWYYYDHAATGRTATIWFGTYQSFQHAVAMGLLFGIAGFFARAAVERKGTAAFLRERAFRLGLPLLLYTLVIDPGDGIFHRRVMAIPRASVVPAGLAGPHHGWRGVQQLRPAVVFAWC